jgi:hypothetical protein
MSENEEPAGMASLGRADWLYDAEYDMHIPCCTALREMDSPDKSKRRCHNGPLSGVEIERGQCSECYPAQVEFRGAQGSPEGDDGGWA